MKKLVITILFSCSILLSFSQRTVADCTVTYSISSENNSDKNGLSGAVKTVYIKGKEIRTDIKSVAFTQSTIYNYNTGTAVVLKEVGSDKYMSTFTAEKWQQQYKRYEGMAMNFTSEKKTILGYECKQAIASLKDGTSFIIYYAPAIIPSAVENVFQFKDIPGFVLEYETTITNTGKHIKYSATSINFNPVPAAKFEIPKSGYKVL